MRRRMHACACLNWPGQNVCGRRRVLEVRGEREKFVDNQQVTEGR